MKLIDILVQELPKRGGWPVDAFYAMQDSDGLVKFSKSKEKTYHDYNDGHEWCSEGGYDWIRNDKPFEGNLRIQVSQDNVTAFISRERYEAALADSKQAWNGDGLPPVGCRVEANYGGKWVEATVAYTDRPEAHGDAVAWKEALVFDCKTTRPFWADEFRPICSEAEKKRAEGVIALSRVDPNVAPFEYGDKHTDGSLIGPFWYELYDAIAAGKIPHIRID